MDFVPFVADVVQSPHHAACNPSHRHDSGFDDAGLAVITRYFHHAAIPRRLNFDIKCAGCCVAYLVTREYAMHATVRGERVEFVPVGQMAPSDFVQAVVRDSKSPNSAQPQLAIDIDLNAAVPGPKVASSGLTYRVYGGAANGVLAMGAVGQVRLECIAMDKVRVIQLELIRTTLAAATILELYRQKIFSGTGDKGRSLHGQAYVINMTPPPPVNESNSSSNKDDDDDDEDVPLDRVVQQIRQLAVTTPKSKKRTKEPSASAPPKHTLK